MKPVARGDLARGGGGLFCKFPRRRLHSHSELPRHTQEDSNKDTFYSDYFMQNKMFLEIFKKPLVETIHHTHTCTSEALA